MHIHILIYPQKYMHMLHIHIHIHIYSASTAAHLISVSTVYTQHDTLPYHSNTISGQYSARDDSRISIHSPIRSLLASEKNPV